MNTMHAHAQIIQVYQLWVLLATSKKFLNQLPKNIRQLLSDITVYQKESRL